MQNRYLYTLTLFVLLAFGMVARADHTGNGIQISGRDAYQTNISAVQLNPNAFSVAAWVRTDEEGRSQIFLSTDRINSGLTFYIYRENVRLLVGLHEMDDYSYVTGPAPAKGKWTHYCGTADGKALRIYRNGKKVGEKPFTSRLEGFGSLMGIGCSNDDVARTLNGALDDIAVWNYPLSPEEVEKISKGTPTDSKTPPVLFWNAKSVPQSALAKGIAMEKTRVAANPLLNTKDNGFRSIWYYNQKINNEYKYKYSGGLGTYPANHYPFAVYCPKVNKTFFCFGGTDTPGEKTLLHEVSCYDHATGMVCRPTIIIDKKTSDAHDNPVMTVDDNGYIWIFSTSHGTGRPSWIHKSVRPYDCSEFTLIEPTKMVDGKEVPMTNFSYMQMFTVPGKGFVGFFTTYDRSLLKDPDSFAARIVCLMTSKDGVHWSDWKPLAAIAFGHYQNAAVYKDEKIGTSFNYHPRDVKEGRMGLNWRTNLYYIESRDMGKTWQSITGEKIAVPMKEVASPSLVYDYEAERLNVYIMDMVYDNAGYPIIFYITSKGFESGPENDPRYACTAHWNGKKWDISKVCRVDNNYDFGSVYVEKDGSWTVIGALDDGPQRFNTGGEMSLWRTTDEGKTWKKERQMTKESPRNHCFPRRPINANPDFYSIWADGNGREKSEAHLYYSNSKGDVFELPREMTTDEVRPVKKN